MTDGPAETPKRKRKWLRRTGYSLLALLLIFVVFHRPILIASIHAVAVKIAAKQHIQLSLDVGGTVLTNLSLKNIRASPSGHGPSPVTRISIDEVSASYSLASLIRRGPQDFLKSYTLRNADIEVKPVEGTSQQKHDLASTLHDIIQQPALFSDRVDIENLNLVAHVPEGDFALKGVTIRLDPVAPGVVQIARLELPKIRTWENLAGTTTYANRDFILRGLQLDPQIVIEQFELDASQRGKGINRLAVNGSFFGGSAQFSMLVRELGKKKAEVQIESHLSRFSLAKISAYFQATAKAPPLGEINDSTLRFSGDPNVPSSWTGSLTATAGPLRAGGVSLEQAVTHLEAKNGAAVLTTELSTKENRVAVVANCVLPRTIDGFRGTTVDGTLTVAAGELKEIAAQITNGDLSATGTFALKNRMLTANLDAKAREVEGENFAVGGGVVRVELSKSLVTPENAPPFEGLRTRISAGLADIRAEKFALDSGEATVTTQDAAVQLEKLDFSRGENTVSASGSYTLPRDMKSFATAPGDAKFALHVPAISAFNAEPNLTGPNGQIEATGTISNGADGYGGKVDLAMTNLAYQDFTARRLDLSVTIAQSVATIRTLNFAINDTDGLTGSGHAELRPPYIYDGALQAAVRDLSKFKDGLAGTLALDWQGSGKAGELLHSGNVRFSLSNGKAAGLTAINTQIAGSYSPELIDLPVCWVTTSKGNFSALIGLKNQQLTIADILVKQANKPLLSGYVIAPLDLRTPKNVDSIVPMDGAVAAEIKTVELDLAALPAFSEAKPAPPKPGKKPAGPPARGKVNALFTATGTVERLDARLQLTGRNLQAAAAPKLAPAALDLDMRLIDDQLSLKGSVTQPAISPVEIAGTLPLPVKQIVKQKKIDEQSPVQLSVRLPRSSMAFLREATPAIRYVEGTAAITADVAGTIAQPTFSGSALLDLPAVRMTKQDAPAISDFHGNVQFEGDRLVVNRLGGNLSGGVFNLGGSVHFPKLTEPQIDLRFTSSNALLVRNESLTVRADSNVTIIGPLNSATVAGEIGLTHSRFFREIEILPIELPGRPAPKPPETAVGFSIDQPPLRDWKFDLAIKTKDPFGIRGNLANGRAVIDLKVVGTGLAPAVEGQVRIENFVASLPFSKLEVNSGYVYFSADNPFVPRLDIQGASSMRDYNISVYIFGNADAPQTVFSSEPPLPQEDIIALLATGSTASELTGSGDVIAGRAAALLFQKAYRKVFKAKEPTENESFVSRFNVDVGAVDSRTGQQEVSTRFKLAEQFYLIGDLDVGGNIRGQVKYLLRFR